MDSDSGASIPETSEESVKPRPMGQALGRPWDAPERGEGDLWWRWSLVHSTLLLLGCAAIVCGRCGQFSQVIKFLSENERWGNFERSTLHGARCFKCIWLTSNALLSQSRSLKIPGV